MSTAVLPMPSRFSIITIAAPGVEAPAWNARLRWPSFGDDHVALDHEGRRSIWAAQLDAAVMRADRAVVLVAEGIGCHAASWWARLTPRSYVSRVAGALMFDPPAEGARDLCPDRPGLGIDDLNDELLMQHLQPGVTGIWQPTDRWDNEWSWDRTWS